MIECFRRRLATDMEEERGLGSRKSIVGSTSLDGAKQERRGRVRVQGLQTVMNGYRFDQSWVVAVAERLFRGGV